MLKETLEKIDRVLPAEGARRRRAAPARAQAIATLEKLLGARLHAELSELYAWSADPGSALDLDDGPEWIGVSGAATALRGLRKLHGDRLPSGRVPITTDGAGSYALFDNAGGGIHAWNQETLDGGLLESSLEAYLAGTVLQPAARAASSRDISNSTSKIVRLPGADLESDDRWGGARAARLLPDGRVLAGFDEATVVWNVGQASPLFECRKQGAALLACDGERAQALCAAKRALSLLDLRALGWRATWMVPGRFDVRSVTISADGNWGASGNAQGIVHLWDLGDGRKDKPLATLGMTGDVGGWIASLAFSPDGRTLAAIAAGGRDGTHVRAWDVGGRRQAWEAKEDARCGAYHPDGTLAIGTAHGAIVCLDPAGDEIHRWKAGGEILALAFAGPDLLLSASPARLEAWSWSKRKRVAAVERGGRDGRDAGLEVLDVLGDQAISAGPLTLWRLQP